MKRSYYIVEGNTVRKADAALPAHPKSTIYERQKKADQRYRASGMLDRGYLAFLVGMVLICAVICASFIRLQSQAMFYSKNITALEEQIENLKRENNATEQRIRISVTLDDVKKRALELGMQPIEAEQIRYYHVAADDYMVQHGFVK